MSRPSQGKQQTAIWRNARGALWSVVSVALVVGSVVSILTDWAPWGYVDRKAAAHLNVLDIVIYMVWSLAPPIWFFLEYNYIFPDERKKDSTAREDLKYTQELGGKMWASLLVVLSVLLLLKYDINVG